jgi:hypothetical protein
MAAHLRRAESKKTNRGGAIARLVTWLDLGPRVLGSYRNPSTALRTTSKFQLPVQFKLLISFQLSRLSSYKSMIYTPVRGHSQYEPRNYSTGTIPCASYAICMRFCCYLLVLYRATEALGIGAYRLGFNKARPNKEGGG